MKVAIMQPYFFPYIGYFQLINKVDTFVFFDDVNFIKRGWINRNRILIDGNPHLITIPLVGASQNKLINEIPVVNNPVWKKKLLTKIEHAYSKCTNFNIVFPLIHELISSNYQLISDYAVASIEMVAEYIGLDTSFEVSSKKYGDIIGNGEFRIIDICKELEADTYFNMAGGKELYDHKNFINEGIDLVFVEPKLKSYNQANFDGFEAGLSIIDLLFNVNREDLSAHL
ncbi:MAG: hypothetical protein EA412_00120 [Chitinophagaceae bacterium]|nr:MAG: hypothetical protein EA412_00120 [Chitinophagaceae bacterium]